MTPTPQEIADRIPCAGCGAYKPYHYGFKGDGMRGHDYRPPARVTQEMRGRITDSYRAEAERKTNATL